MIEGGIMQERVKGRGRVGSVSHKCHRCLWQSQGDREHLVCVR